MPVEIVDMVKTAHELKKRKVLLNTKRFHAWVHHYPNPGDKDDMHCHNADAIRSTVNPLTKTLP
jgi:hypothetical protein